MNTQHLASSLRSAIAALHKSLRKQTKVADAYSMTELETIAHLSRTARLLPTELASFTKVKAQSMSSILKRMEKNGIIKRTPSKEDKRKVYISLTALGKKTVEHTRYEKDEWLKTTIENTLTGKEKELLIKILPVLNKLSQTNQL
jgi:DNA-binding MarR family transcriptional regulator